MRKTKRHEIGIKLFVNVSDYEPNTFHAINVNRFYLHISN